MSSYNTPPLPTIPLTGGMGGQTTNPWFTIANQFVPRNLHDVIRWARYITLQSPTTSEVIRKLSTYPITEFEMDTNKDDLKKKYQEVFKSFKLKEFLQNVGFEFFTIGNSFISIYFPIHRTLTCNTCATSYNAKKAEWITFKQYQFYGECPHCKAKGVFKRTDTKSIAVEDMNVIKWTAEHMVVNHNPITGESEYFYRIPNVVKQKIQKGDKLFVNSIPWGFVEAVKFNQDFKFDSSNIFHLQNMTTGGSVEGISIPPLLSLFSLVFYQATLRKANEAIATEYLNPLRVIFPQAQTANSDPVVSMSLRNFVNNMEDALKRHKQDVNHMVIAPTPVGYTPIGGEGKNLLVSQEIQQAEETILLSLGVSKELLSGTSNWTSSSVGLRMMENLLFSYISRLQDLIDWITNKLTSYLNIEKVGVKLTPFKLIDDDNFKNIILQLNQLNKVSDSTLLTEIGLDYTKEQNHLKEEQITKARVQIELQYEVEQAQILAAKDKAKDMQDNEESQMIIQKAQMGAQQLSQLDDASRQQFLDELKTSDYTQWVLISMYLNQGMSGQNQVQAVPGQTEDNAPQPGQQDPNQDPNDPNQDPKGGSDKGGGKDSGKDPKKASKKSPGESGSGPTKPQPPRTGDK